MSKHEMPDFTSPGSMHELLRRAIGSAGKDSCRSLPRWAHVMNMLGHGAGYSARICRQFGFDPDEIVGGLIDGTYCPSCKRCLGCGEHIECEHSEECEGQGWPL